MRKTILLALLFTFCSIFSEVKAWDSTAAKYLPLRVGNVWVYDCYSMGYLFYNRYFVMYRINETFDTLGHTYYRFQTRFVWVSNSNGAMCYQPTVIRIDSARMNVYSAFAYCGSYEFLEDSLKARMNDNSPTCQAYGYYSRCLDTNKYYIFSDSIPSKYFQEFHGSGTNRRYAKDIGIAAWDWGYMQNSCHDRLKGCVINGVVRGDTGMLVGLHEIGTEVPDKFLLSQNYPNPFNPNTVVRFQLPAAGFTKLIIYDLLGKEVATIVNEELKPGTYEVEWDGTNFASGIYFYKLAAGEFTETKRMILMK